MPAIRMREALRDAMAEEMRRDESVFVMGEDVAVFQGSFKVTEGLLDEFGEKRVRDTPISENTIVGMGVGAGMGGLRPIVEIMTVNFALLAMDQIVNHAAAIPYMFGGQVRVPLVIRMPGGGGHQLGPTHSHSFEAMFLQIPGLLVACPSSSTSRCTAFAVRSPRTATVSSTSARPTSAGRALTSPSSRSCGWSRWLCRLPRHSPMSMASRPR
jgi:pyruvate dehydrogenase E1 component beta subunit